MGAKPRIAIDLDLTLGEAVIDFIRNDVVGFRIRPGSKELLEKLKERYTVCLWTTSSRWYLEAIFSLGLDNSFEQTYAGDEVRGDWKDIRRIDVEYLIDDSKYHRDCASKEGLDTDRYIIIPSYGSPEDLADPSRWLRVIEQKLLENERHV